MAYEILYAFSPYGLVPGTSGFCMVLATESLPEALPAAVSSLNGYKSYPGARRPPVAWSKIAVESDGQSWQLISRVCETAEKSGRLGPIAHHLAFWRTEEIAQCSPGALLQTPGAFIDSFDGNVREILERNFSGLNQSPGFCSAWQRITGDAGWGGVLAETAIKKQPACILFDPNTDIAPLICESLALLPADKRWDVSFSTLYSSSIAAYPCLWRGAIADSPEALRATSEPGVQIFDLTKPMGTAPASRYVEAARIGLAPSAGTGTVQSDSPAPSSSSPVPSPAPSSISGKAPVEVSSLRKRTPQPRHNAPPAPPVAKPDATSAGSRTPLRRSVVGWLPWILLLTLNLAIGGLSVWNYQTGNTLSHWFWTNDKTINDRLARLEEKAAGPSEIDPEDLPVSVQNVHALYGELDNAFLQIRALTQAPSGTPADLRLLKELADCLETVRSHDENLPAPFRSAFQDLQSAIDNLLPLILKNVAENGNAPIPLSVPEFTDFRQKLERLLLLCAQKLICLDRGNPEYAYRLGEFFELGLGGVEAKMERAREYYIFAAEDGSFLAKKALERLPKLTKREKAFDELLK